VPLQTQRRDFILNLSEAHLWDLAVFMRKFSGVVNFVKNFGFGHRLIQARVA
jgi:hypothetical protein